MGSWKREIKAPLTTSKNPKAKVKRAEDACTKRCLPMKSMLQPACVAVLSSKAKLTVMVWLLGLGCNFSEEQSLIEEGQRAHGALARREKAELRAEDPIAVSQIPLDPKVKARVLQMHFTEAVARLGPLEYEGQLKLQLKHKATGLTLIENTRIETHPDGSFRVFQTEAKDRILRELFFKEGQLYVRNGNGELRRREQGDKTALALRQESFEALSVFFENYGPRFGLEAQKQSQSQNRRLQHFKVSLAKGDPVIQTPRGRFRPLALSGDLAVDLEAGVVLSAQIEGKAKMLGQKPGAAQQDLSWSLNYQLRAGGSKPIKLGAWIPEIHRRPVDLDPLAFLRGGTRTSTVIRGQGQQ